jgi:hypothetical protein
MSGNFAKYIAFIFFCLLLKTATGQETDTEPYHSELRAVPDSVTGKMKNDRDFLYANDPSYWVEKQPEPSPFASFLAKIARSPLLKWVMYSFLAAVILFVLYQVMVVNNFFFFSKRFRSKKGEPETHDEELNADNIDQKLNEAVAAGDYRLAIRYLYLKTLYLLNEKKLIALQSQATNHEYLLQMQKQEAAKDFRKLTQVYEYVWYGEYRPSDDQFNTIQTNFKHFFSRI